MLTHCVNSVDFPPKWACTGRLPTDEKLRKLVTVGRCLARRRDRGVRSNAGAAHPQTDASVFGYHPTGSIGTLFLFGIAVGAVASLHLGGLPAGHRTPPTN